jgi:hypothetical protein
MPQFPGIFDTIGRKSLLFAFFNARERARSVANYAAARKEGANGGNQGFPDYNWR